MKSNSKSLYSSVKTRLIEQIRKMDLSASTKLPREESLAQSMGVSRVTVRRVLAELSQEGIVMRKHGRGTFVNADVLKINTSFCPALEFDEIIKNSERTPRTDVLSLTERPANKKEMEALQLIEGERVIEMRKVVYADENPAIFCMDVIPKKLLPYKLTKEDFIQSAFKVLEVRTKKTVICDIVEISTALNTQIVEFPEFKDSATIKPLLLCTSTNYDTENKPVIYGRVYYDTDFIKFRTLRQMESTF